MVVNILFIKIPWRVRDHEKANVGINGSSSFFTLFSIYIMLYFNVSSTLLQKNQDTCFLIRSKIRIVEHSTIIRNGKIQHQIPYKEYSPSIAEWLLATPNWENQAFPMMNALESSFFPQPWFIHLLQEHIWLQVYQESPSYWQAIRIWRNAKDGAIDQIQMS